MRGLACRANNRPQFTSETFKLFLCRNGVEHVFSPPYHPSANGAAERNVGTLKSCLKKHLYAERHGLQQGLDIHQLVDKFLLIYRTTPHSTTGRTPAKLLLKHQPRTRFSFLKPVASSMPASKNLGKPLRWRFETQERVLLRNYLGGPSG